MSSREKTIGKDKFDTKIILRRYIEGTRRMVHHDLYTDGPAYLTRPLARKLAKELLKFADRAPERMSHPLVAPTPKESE
jgi:hypothetical protein